MEGAEPNVECAVGRCCEEARRLFAVADGAFHRSDVDEHRPEVRLSGNPMGCSIEHICTMGLN